MSQYRISVLSGVVDGINDLFASPQSFIVGSTQVMVDGLARRAEDADGWDEVGITGIRLKQPPSIGSWVASAYRTQEPQVGQPDFEIPVGLIDGVNALFTMAAPYTPGSLIHWADGLARNPADSDGLIETDPALGTLTTKLVLPIGTALIVFRLDTQASGIVGVTPIAGAIDASIKQALFVYAGENKVYQLTVTLGGVPLNLTGATIEFQIKRGLGDPDPALIFKTSAVPGEIDILDQTAGQPTVGKANIEIVPSDTSPTPEPKVYKFDVIIVLANGDRHVIVPPSNFDIRDIVNPV